MKPPMIPPLVESEISQITPWEKIQRRRQPNEQEAGQRNLNNKQHYLTSRRHKLGSRGNNQSTLLQCWGFEERDVAQSYTNKRKTEFSFGDSKCFKPKSVLRCASHNIHNLSLIHI